MSQGTSGFSNSRLYALRKLKKAGLSDKDLVTIYSSFIRSRIEYASPAWSTLTQGQSDLIESIQRRALRILLPEMSYQDALNYTGLKKLSTRRHNSCEQFIRKLKLDNGPINPLKVIPQFCIAHFYCAHLITYNFIHYIRTVLGKKSFYDNFMLLQNIFGYIRAKNYVKNNVFKKGIQKCR